MGAFDVSLRPLYDVPEARELAEAIQDTYAACRGQDTLLLRRAAAVTNRSGEALVAAGEARPYPPIPEGGYGVLYREEITEALAQVEGPPIDPAGTAPKNENNAKNTTTGGK